MKIHPIAEVFPLLDGAHLDQLAASIKSVGQLHPIIVLDDMVLDGRCRLAACKLARVEPKTIQYKGKKDIASLIAFVDAVNDKRRHLSQSQRAVSAFKLTKLAPDKKCQLALSQADAAEKLGVSERSVKRASKVVQSAVPAIVDKVIAGTLSVSKAATIAELPKKEQQAAMKSVSIKPQKNGQVTRDGRLWQLWDDAFGKLVRLTGDLKNHFPNPALHSQLRDRLNDAIKIKDQWKASSK